MRTKGRRRAVVAVARKLAVYSTVSGSTAVNSVRNKLEARHEQVAYHLT